jgi:hypothetical protein
MRKSTSFPVLILSCLFLSGCSIPSAARYTQLYSLTKEEKKVSSGLGGKRKVVLIKDFRENEMYEEDLAALKEEVEKYIASHPDLSEAAKNNLRALKVAEGATKEEVKLLLGEPDKASPGHASEVWIYRISKMRAFSVFIVPVFFAHEGYYLYFKDGVLTAIERHYPKQIVEQGAAPGINAKE